MDVADEKKFESMLGVFVIEAVAGMIKAVHL